MQMIKNAETLAGVHTHTHTHTHTGILLNENKLCDREDNSLLENKGLLSEFKKYSNTIFVSILDTGWGGCYFFVFKISRKNW